MLASIVLMEYIVFGSAAIAANVIAVRRDVRTLRRAATYVIVVAVLAWAISHATLRDQSTYLFFAMWILVSTEIIWERERQRNLKKPFIERAKKRARWLDRIIPGAQNRYAANLDEWARSTRDKEPGSRDR